MQTLNSDSIITLGQNIAFLLCLPLVCHFLWQTLRTSPPRISEAITGIAFAVIAIIGMLSPVRLFEGLFVDGRVAILAVAGLYSTPTGIVAALLIASFRIVLGGVGTAPAVATILTAMAIGIGARKFFSATLHRYQVTVLLVIGLVLVLATAVWALLASAPQSQAALKTILVPILVWYPACTILLGNLFAQEFARQDSEKALRISSERYLSIVNDQLDPVIRWQGDGTITFVNDAYCRLRQRPAADFIGRKAFVLLGEFKQEEHRAAIEQLSVRQPVHNQVYRIVAPDASQRWIEWTDRAFFQEDLQLREVQSVGRDVTALMEAADKLQHQSVFQNLFLRLATDLINVAPEHFDEAINMALKDIGLLLHGNRCVIQHYDNKHKQYTRAYEWHGPGVISRMNVTSPMTPASNYIIDRLVRKENVLIEDITQISEFHDLPAVLNDFQATAFIPIFRGEELVGVVNINWDRPNRISEEMLHLLRVLGEIYLSATDRIGKEAQIRTLNTELEQRVTERTIDLVRINRRLQDENSERTAAEQALRRREGQLRSILDSSPISMIVINRSGTILYLNQVSASLLGLDGKKSSTHNITEFFANQTDRIELEQELDNQNYIENHETLIRSFDGLLRHGLVSSRSFEYGEESAFLVAVVDVTELRKTQESEQKQRTLTEALLDSAMALTSTLQLDEVVNHILRSVYRVTAHDVANVMILDGDEAQVIGSRNYITGGQDYQLVTTRLNYRGDFAISLMLETLHPVIIPDITTDPHFKRISVGPVLRGYLGVPIVVGEKLIGLISLGSQHADFFTEVDARYLQIFAVQAGIAIQNAQLYDQARTIAALEERQRLARELHDSVTQTLFSASIIADALPNLVAMNSPKAQSYLAELRGLTRGGVAEMRSLLMELRPEALEHAPIVLLLTQLSEVFTSRTQIKIEKRVNQSPDLDRIEPEVKIMFYRIAQQALNNIAEHAHAHHVSLGIQIVDGLISMQIKDDGKGFDPEKIPIDHFGLKIMKERATKGKAVLQINSQIGRGTEINLERHIPG